MSDSSGDILKVIDNVVPLKQFDAFPKVPQTYRSRTSYGGLMTAFVALVSFVLILNDIGEFIWGWPDYEFGVDNILAEVMSINVDMTVAMPCHFLTIDLRDATGDRLHFQDGLRRDGTTFDSAQAIALKDHAINMHQISVGDVAAASRNARNRGFFSFFRSAKRPQFRPTYNHVPDGSACRVYGSMQVKKMTANLHITTLGHGYSSHEHTDHKLMNLSHVITEFSFGPYIPDIVQPLDYSVEITHNPFTVFQYFMTVVPTTYYAPRSFPVRTNQYSTTHYVRQIEHGAGAPGIFFKFDIDPLQLSIYQRTTTLLQFLIRVIGVVGGVWVCATWAFKITSKAVVVVVGDENDETIALASSSRKSRWNGGNLNRRKGSWNPQQGGWVTENGSPYSSYSNTPTSAVFGPGTPTTPYSRASVYDNYPPSAPASQTQFASTFPSSPVPGSGGFPMGPPTPSAGSTFAHTPGYLAPTSHASASFPAPPTPSSGQFPHSPGPMTPSSATEGQFPRSPVPGQTFANVQIRAAPPPRRLSRLNPNRNSISGSGLSSGASGGEESEA
jgi:hypothetical protein